MYSCPHVHCQIHNVSQIPNQGLMFHFSNHSWGGQKTRSQKIIQMATVPNLSEMQQTYIQHLPAGFDFYPPFVAIST